MINLDANATYAPIGDIIQHTIDKCNNCLNASSVHLSGQKSRSLIEEARHSVRHLIGANKEDKIIFSSGATESNNSFFLSFLLAKQNQKLKVLTSLVEHSSIIEPCRRITKLGGEESFIPPSSESMVDLNILERAVKTFKPDVASFMLANNESGEINPINEISRIIRKFSPETVIHCDAVQGIGKYEINFREIEVDALSISGHKIGALSGIGALILRPELDIIPTFIGGNQENKLRAGGENLYGIASLGIATDLWSKNGRSWRNKLSDTRTLLMENLLKNCPDIIIQLTGRPSLPNTLCITLPNNIRADDFVVAMDLAGIAISSGAACSSGKQDGSHVFKALDLPVFNTIRFSFRHDLTYHQIILICDTCRNLIDKMRE
jgi:cysteine desulfurase